MGEAVDDASEYTPLETLLYDDLRTLTETYAKAVGLSVASVAKKSCHDSSFFQRHTDNRSFRIRVYDQATAWYNDNWPNGLLWPDAIDRPPPGWKPPEYGPVIPRVKKAKGPPKRARKKPATKKASAS